MTVIRQTRLFRGFNTVTPDTTHNWTLFDIDLVKQDLSNHFNTRVGERVMRPTFGCSIWEYLNEPLTLANKELIQEEAVRVCNADSRLNFIAMEIAEFENGIRLQITLEYVPFSVIDVFTMQFEQRQNANTGNQLLLT